MRVLVLCVVSTVVAAGSAAIVLAPGEEDEAAALAPRATVSVSVDAAIWLPLQPCRTQPAVLRPLIPENVAPAQPADESRAAELERLEAELRSTLIKLARAEQRIGQLVFDHCQERFDFELDQWLDGSLAPLHEDDSRMRDQLREALSCTAAEHGRRSLWDAESGYWYQGECPEEVAVLRSRLPDGLVAQLAGLFRDWDADRQSRPQVIFIGGCGNARSAARPTVEVEYGDRRSTYLRGDPYVQGLLDEQSRADRDWKLRINVLVDAEVFELD